MSEKSKSIIKGAIFLLLGTVVTCEEVILHIEDIFIYLGFISIGFGAYLIITGFFKGENNKTSPYRASNNHYQKNLENSSNEKDILDKVQINKQKSSSKPKMNMRFPKFSRSKTTNKSKSHDLKSNLFNTSKIKSQKSKPGKQISNPFVFTPNYERPSNITRKPVKKHLNSSKTRKLSKIKPTIPINHLSKTLGLEKKEDIELIKLKKMLTDDNSKNDSNLNNSTQNDSIQDISTLNHPIQKNTALNRPTPKNHSHNPNKSIKINDPNKNNDLVNEEILNNMIKEDLKNKDDTQNFMSKLNEVHIFCDDKSLKFNEALEKLSKEVKKEIAIEIPNLKSLSNKLLLALNYLNTRIIVEKFDVKDISHSFIVSSLLENKNISIKTIDTIDTIKIIVDNNYALVLSELLNSEMGIGAIFTKKKEIDSVKDTFDLLWKISEEL